LLYFTGGLVLGETIALWMKAEQVCVGLAALLLVLSYVFLCGGFHKRGRGRNGGRLPALFRYLLVIWLGMTVGAGRMEYEEWLVQTEQKVIARAAEAVEAGSKLTGRLTEIQRVDFGVRLTVEGCKIDWNQETSSVRKVYVYTDSSESLRLGMQVVALGRCEIPEPDRNPGGFDYRLYCQAKGICGLFRADIVDCMQNTDDYHTPQEFFAVWYWTWREWVRQAGLALECRLEKIAEPEDLGILKAVLLGEKADMDDDLYALYQRNGISHVLAISGLHVSVVGMGLWRLLRIAGLGYLQAGSIAFSVLFVYGTMVGFGPSVVRAVFMVGVSFCAGFLGRTYDLPSAMCVPAMGILLWRPYMLTQASFQLSFLAVGAMFVPGNVLAQKWQWKGVKEKIWVSLSLQLVTFPFVLLHSYEIPMFGMMLNLLVVPLMAYVLISGMLGVAGSFVWSGLGIGLLGGAHIILAIYQRVCLGIQQFPNANLILGQPEIWKIIVYYGLLIIGTWKGFQCGKRWLCLWGIGILLLVWRPDTGLSVMILDVGQGDGIFLEADGRTMLVDCGSSQDREIGDDVLIPFLKSQGVRRLDTVVVTHGDQDHMNGIRTLLETQDHGIEIGQIMISKAGMMDSGCQGIVELAEKQELSVIYCEAGDVLTGALGEDVEIFCLHPGVPDVQENDDPADRNGDSVVLYMVYGAFSMLLTGDIGVSEEQALLRQYDFSLVTVLKAAHHGSANSNSREFLEAVRPSYVVFSYGEGNSYGHPSSRVLEDCMDVGAQAYETAKSGALQIWTDGTHLRIEGWLDREDGI